MKLYGGDLRIGNDLVNDIAQKTKGVSASFIKELMRRLAQYSIERGDDGQATSADVKLALEEMLFTNNALNLSVLGAN